MHPNYSLSTPSVELLSAMQLRNVNEPLFPNLISLFFRRIEEPSIPFFFLFLSPRITSIHIGFRYTPSKVAIVSVITTLPKRCPNLQTIGLRPLPRDPVITASVSRMLLATNWDTLQALYVNSPLTEEANNVLYKLPNLRDLSVVIERATPLPSASLPNLTELSIECDDDGSWPELFRRATLGKLESIVFGIQSEQIGNFLEVFERAALSCSIQNTLSELYFSTSSSWNPNYSSLLPFTRLVDLVVRFSCSNVCSSTLDDDIIVDLPQAMPKLELLRLSDDPCGEPTAGVTTKGLMALARHCPNLDFLCIHFQATSLCAPPTGPGMTPDTDSTIIRTDCTLTHLVLGKMPVPEGSASTVAQTLLCIFPRIETIEFINEGWKEVESAILNSRRIDDHPGKKRTLTTC